MALLHADNFSIYGTDMSLLTNGIYAEVNGSLTSDPDGLSSGRVLNTENTTSNSSRPFRYVSQEGPKDTMGFCLRLWYTNLPNNNTGQFQVQFRNTSNDNIAALYITATGQVTFYTFGGESFTTDIPVVTANGWYHYEVKFTKVTAATCDFEVRVEGITVLSGEGVAVPVPDDPAQVCASRANISINHNVFIKDLVIWNGEGTYNNDFLGTVLVTSLLPVSDISLNWTPSSGSTGYTILDNIPPSNSQFLSAGFDPVPPAYVGELSDLPIDATSVKGLITFVRAAKSDGGDGSLQNGLISDPDGTPATALGADRPITVAQTYWRDVFETDPKTGAPWIPAAVNETQIRINRTT